MTLTPDGEDLTFDCPRCDKEAVGRFYGPCANCVAVLQEAQAGEGRDLEVAAYEPKMNVVPNQVASKD
jgi:hypothetical protein